MYELLPDMPTDELSGVTHIGNDAYTFKFVIFDSEGRNLVIKKQSIEDLVLIDDIKNWFHYGHADIKNPQDTLERSTESNFAFRNDGQLFLYFAIEPNISSNPQEQINLNSRIYSMDFLFVIHDVEDIENDIENKVKRLYFTDARNYILKTQHSYFSTNNTYRKITNKSSAHALDPSVNTGEALKDLISTAIGPSINVGFEDDFDLGSTKIQYTSPCSYSGYDDLMYIMNDHVSTDETFNAPCILKSDRFVNQSKFSFLPITTIFNLAQNNGNPGYLCSELFLIGTPDTTGRQSKVSFQRTPRGSTVSRNVHMQDKSIINNYYFDDIPADMNDSELVSRIGHMFDYKNSKFNIFCTDGFIENLKSNFKSHIVDKMMVDTESKGQVAWLTNSKKRQNKLFKHSFFGDKEGNISRFKPRNDAMLSSILDGRKIVFEVPGMTNRKSLQFIGIDRQGEVTDNKLDDKLLGQYFVTKVKHVFDDEGYTNHITATKQYNFKPIHDE